MQSKLAKIKIVLHRQPKNAIQIAKNTNLIAIPQKQCNQNQQNSKLYCIPQPSTQPTQKSQQTKTAPPPGCCLLSTIIKSDQLVDRLKVSIKALADDCLLSIVGHIGDLAERLALVDLTDVHLHARNGYCLQSIKQCY